MRPTRLQDKREIMPSNLASIVQTLTIRSSLSLARGSLFKFVGLLAAVFVLASLSLIYLAHDLDRTEEVESAFYTKKAVQSLEKSMRSTVKDYAFWGDAYKHLHTEVDTDWAYVRQNIGSTLYTDFGMQGVFVVNDVNRTVYSVIKGELKPVEAADWLDQSIVGILDKARAGAETETPITTFINVRGTPVLVAAAAITPGTDPTVALDDRLPSVLVFVDMLNSTKLELIGGDFGVDHLHVATPDEKDAGSLLALGDNGAAGSLHWKSSQPGLRLLGIGLPLIGVAALLVWLMT